MKKYSLLIPVILTGCINVEVERANLEETYAELTSGEKTFEKAYKVYQFYDSNMCELYKPGCGEEDYRHQWLPINYSGAIPDFLLRFCTLDSLADIHSYGRYDSDDLVRKALKVRMFEQKTGLVVSDEERYCLESICEYKYDGNNVIRIKNFVHNDDKCIVLRRKLIQDDIRCQCVFDYKMYLPDDIKISSLEAFKELHAAYESDIRECERARAALVLTSDEYQNCIDSVEQKLQELIKSGDL